jgi:transcriptional regulator with XRE-family HTH domain
MEKQLILSPEDLAKTLKARRKELGITQKQLADFCDLSHNGISRIEIGDSDVKLSTLLKMSKLLGFTIVLDMVD